MYVLKKNNIFTLNQTLNSFRCEDVKYFTIHGNHFLVAANEINGQSYSVVYRWEAGKLEEFHRIPTNGVEDIHYFTINTRKFITFTNIKYHRLELSIYEWKNKKFSKKIQDIQLNKISKKMHHFCHSQHHVYRVQQRVDCRYSHSSEMVRKTV